MSIFDNMHQMEVSDLDPADNTHKFMGRKITCLCPIGHDHTEDEFDERSLKQEEA